TMWKVPIMLRVAQCLVQEEKLPEALKQCEQLSDDDAGAAPYRVELLLLRSSLVLSISDEGQRDYRRKQPRSIADADHALELLAGHPGSALYRDGENSKGGGAPFYAGLAVRNRQWMEEASGLFEETTKGCQEPARRWEYAYYAWKSYTHLVHLFGAGQ